jgi:predicted porin
MRRILAGVAAGALIAAGAVAVPAIGAAEGVRAKPAPKRGTSLRGIGSFTPSSADPRLAAAFARGGLDTRGFRFTPAEAKNSRAVTVAVRARSNRAVVADRAGPAAAPTVGLAPIAYNLGVAVGWRRFAMSGDLAKVDLPGQPGGRESAEVGVSYSLPRLTTRVKAGADRAVGDAPSIAGGERSYSLDVGGSYSLTRNLDVTAGVRYRSDRERITRVDDRRDSQAVYVGTAFRF